MSELRDLIYGSSKDDDPQRRNDGGDAPTKFLPIKRPKSMLAADDTQPDETETTDNNIPNRNKRKRKTPASDDSSYEEESSGDDDDDHKEPSTQRETSILCEPTKPRAVDTNIYDTTNEDMFMMDADELDDEAAAFLYPDRTPFATQQRPPVHKTTNNQRKGVRERWKQRHYDLREEVDIGDAVFHKVSASFQQQQTRFAPEVVEDTVGAEGMEEDDDGDNTSEVSDSMVHEQTSILNQLLVGSQPDDGEDAAEEQKDGDDDEEEATGETALDWWELGYSGPRHVEPLNPSGVPLACTEESPDDDNDTGADVVTAPYKATLTKTYWKKLKHQFFPMSPLPDSAFNHSRHILSLIARVMASGVCTQEHVELLWRLHTAPAGNERGANTLFSTQRYVDQLCRFRGRQVAIYYQYEWKDHRLAADILCSLSDIDVPRYHELPTRLKANVKGKAVRPFDLSVSRYVHIPGTKPPIPSFPLDATEIIWGAKGRYSDVQHACNAERVVDESVYKLSLSALLCADERETASDLILHAVQVNQSRAYKRYQTSLSLQEFEMPLHHFAQTVAYALALVDDPLEDVLERVLDHNGLRMFRGLHLTSALLSIAKEIPEDTRAFLAQSSNGLSPVDLFRQLLEDQIDFDFCSRDKLEYVIHKHSEDVSTRRNPSDIQFHAWRLAFLSSSLFLCGSSTEGQVTSFQNVRKELAEALLRLVKLCHHQQPQSCLAHETIKSVCEWKAVVSLLFGKTETQNVQDLQRFHERRWRELDATEESCQTSKSAIEKAMLQLERRPDVKENWIRLACSLGPVGQEESDSCRTCAAGCSLLLGELHVRQPKRHWEGREWWRQELLLPLFGQPDIELLDCTEEIEKCLVKVLKKRKSSTRAKSRADSIASFDFPEIYWFESFVRNIGEDDKASLHEIDDLEPSLFESDGGHLASDHDDSLDSVDESMAVLTCKILICCHNGMIADDEVGAFTLQFIQLGWGGKRLSKDCICCLNFLIDHDIDVGRLFLRATQHYWNRFLQKKDGQIWRCL